MHDDGLKEPIPTDGRGTKRSKVFCFFFQKKVLALRCLYPAHRTHRRRRITLRLAFRVQRTQQRVA